MAEKVDSEIVAEIAEKVIKKLNAAGFPVAECGGFECSHAYSISTMSDCPYDFTCKSGDFKCGDVFDCQRFKG